MKERKKEKEKKIEQHGSHGRKLASNRKQKSQTGGGAANGLSFSASREIIE